MATLILRAYQETADFRAIANLINTCVMFDQFGEDTSLSEFQFLLHSPEINASQDTCLIETKTGQCIGIALIQIQALATELEGYLWLFVHPEFRHQRFEADLVRWGEKRLCQAQEHSSQVPVLRIYSRADQPHWNECLMSYGFTLERQFSTLVRETHLSSPTPELPAGFTLVDQSVNPWSSSNLQAWVELYNESFTDHWNHHDLTVETLKYWQEQPDYQPELDLIAVAPTGELAAFCSCRLKPQNLDHSTGWIEWLGSRRGFRRLGLGRAVLLAGLQRLQGAGADLIKLSVDAENWTGAVRLYQSVGFHPLETWLSWAKPLGTKRLF
ncbi:MAG: GNAT family N-acetyltransferase [Microcoleaceae cyanobacterium]